MTNPKLDFTTKFTLGESVTLAHALAHTEANDKLVKRTRERPFLKLAEEIPLDVPLVITLGHKVEVDRMRQRDKVIYLLDVEPYPDGPRYFLR